MSFEVEIWSKGINYKIGFSEIDREYVENLPSLSVTVDSETGYKWVRINIPRSGGYSSATVARLILERKIGAPIPEGIQAEHSNGNTLDNTRENLRLATPSQNGVNKQWDREYYIWISKAEGVFRTNSSFHKSIDESLHSGRSFSTLHDAIKYVYPIHQAHRGEFSPEKRTLEQVLSEIPDQKADRIAGNRIDGVECPKCHKMIKSKYKEHVECCDKVYKCQHCGKVEPDQSKLTRHENTHTKNGAKPFPCDKCDKSYENTDARTKHIREVHEGIKPNPLTDEQKERRRTRARELEKEKAEKEGKIYKPRGPYKT